MNLPTLLFGAITALLFCILSILIVRLTFDRVGKHVSRNFTGIALLVSCIVFSLVIHYQNESLCDQIFRHTCESQLDRIYVLYERYLQQEGFPPDELDDLVRRYEIERSNLICPATRQPYRYEASAQESEKRVLCADASPHNFEVLWVHRQTRPELHVDGKVAWIDVPLPTH